MLAVIQKVQIGYTAKFERHLNHPVEKVWAILTDNDQLARWFPELRVEDLRKGGVITFDMQNGTFEKMEILELKHQALLEYTWDQDRVRFELYPDEDGCQLVLIEKLSQLTAHTPRDLAGWHVCLDTIIALLDKKTIERKEEWERWYRQYSELVRGNHLFNEK